MGANQSSPSNGSQHVFASENPVRFSQDLVNSLQSSTETNGSRQQSYEAQIQDRVQAELRRIQDREAKLLEELEEKISAEASNKGEDKDSKAAGKKLRDLGRESIQKDITSLRQKLEGRKKLEDLDKSVEKAKDDVTTCLRLNDRRPLDCWKEVEAFKREVGKLEKSFVEKALS